MVPAAGKGDGLEAGVQGGQGLGLLLVHAGGHHENCVLDGEEVGDVHDGLVELGGGGDGVGRQKRLEVVHTELGVVAHRDDRKHDLQPYWGRGAGLHSRLLEIEENIEQV